MFVVAAAGAVLIASQAKVQAPASTPTQIQAKAGDDQVWKEFITWFKTAPAGGDPFRLYGEELAKQGIDRGGDRAPLRRHHAPLRDQAGRGRGLL